MWHKQYFREGASGEQKLWTLHEKCPHNLELFVQKKKKKKNPANIGGLEQLLILLVSW